MGGGGEWEIHFVSWYNHTVIFADHFSLYTISAYILGQLKLGMDLTKVVLPTFILERKSLLELFANCFSHPDIFMSITDGKLLRGRGVGFINYREKYYLEGMGNLNFIRNGHNQCFTKIYRWPN